MGYFIAIALSLIAGFTVGVIFSGKIVAEIKTLTQTIHERLVAIENALKAFVDKKL